jgi:transcriptional regulator with XRE-family HTH domain
MNTERDEFRDLLAEVRSSEEYRLEDFVQSFSDELWAEMSAQKITKAELARRAGINRQFLTGIFRGKHNLTARTMVKLAEALGLRVCQHLAPKDVECEWFHFAQVEVPVARHQSDDESFGEPISFHGVVSDLPATSHNENLRVAA